MTIGTGRDHATERHVRLNMHVRRSQPSLNSSTPEASLHHGQDFAGEPVQADNAVRAIRMPP